jgi:hypothetical protein
MNIHENKFSLCNQLKIIFARRRDEIALTIKSIIESRDSNTKSSAGDKHETARAMMQIELDNNENQLAKIVGTLNDLARIDISKVSAKAEFGSLIFTSQGNYFISIGFGKLDHEGTTYYAVSPKSPIGLALKNKCEGDKFNFQGREFLVEEVG